MKLQTSRNVESTFGDDFTSNDFSVVVSGKLFDLTLDKLYTNKIRSILRELWTNAYDAHVAAGCADQPFFCQLPSPLDPTFTVRDYGCAMDHDFVMKSYSSLFFSPKTEGENADDFVGAFGLGSKSPFAYTSAFYVKVWLDGVVRLYLCARDSEGTPSITHLSTEDSDEPRGVEVSFPVQAHQFKDFREEARHVARGFDVKPTIPGLELISETPLFEGSNWRVYENQSYNAVRQGCVIYPVHDIHVTTNLNYGCGLVVDVAIGTCDVAMNREGLSLDERTGENVRRVLEEASVEMQGAVLSFIENAPDFFDATKRYITMSKLFRLGRIEYKGQVLNGVIEFKDGQRTTPENVFDAKGKPARVRCHVDNAHELRFVIDRTGNSVPRKTTRYRRWRDSLYRSQSLIVFQLKDPTSKQLAALVRRLHLKPEQIIPIASLPDVKIERAPRGKSSSAAGVYQLSITDGRFPTAVEKMASDYYWVECARIDGNYMDLGSFGSSLSSGVARNTIRNLARQAKITKPIYLMTPSAIKRFKPKENMNVLTELEKWVKAHESMILDEYKLKRIVTHVRQSGIYDPTLLDKLLEHVTPSASSITEEYGGLTDTLVTKFFSDKVSDLKEETQSVVVKLREEFPLIFGTSNDSLIKYVDLVRSGKFDLSDDDEN